MHRRRLRADHEPGLPHRGGCRRGIVRGAGARTRLRDRRAAGARPRRGVQGSARGDPNLLTGIFGRSSRLTRLFPTLRGGSSQRLRHRPRHGGPRGPRRLGVGRVHAGAAQRPGRDRRFRRTCTSCTWEDADLCRRVRATGLTVRYVPDARVRHAVGGSSRHARGAAVRAFHDSAFLYYATHVAPGRWEPQALAGVGDAQGALRLAARSTGAGGRRRYLTRVSPP